jgi:hypothetical protein
MTFRTYSAAENYLKNSGYSGYVETRRYTEGHTTFCEYTVVFY